MCLRIHPPMNGAMIRSSPGACISTRRVKRDPAWHGANTVLAPRGSLWRQLSEAGLFALVMTVSSLQIATMFARRWRPPAWAAKLLAWLSPFRSINRYGLFAVMTTTRPEIIVEASEDGVHWEPYVFRYKPQDPRRAPGFVAPHQPRLDWQIWFAALGDLWMNPWFVRFLIRLLEGSPAVTALLASTSTRWPAWPSGGNRGSSGSERNSASTARRWS